MFFNGQFCTYSKLLVAANSTWNLPGCFSPWLPDNQRRSSHALSSILAVGAAVAPVKDDAPVKYVAAVKPWAVRGASGGGRPYRLGPPPPPLWDPGERGANWGGNTQKY